MKSLDNTQEILLLTNNTFSKRQFADNNFQPGESSARKTPDQLAQACWNGLLSSILPDIVNWESKLFLWEVINHRAFLRLSLGVRPPVIDPVFSLNPEFFLENKPMN
jgi:hypothetical protein